MITYNHEAYIEQAIESVINQHTNFEYELVIGEDFSKDSTREICKNLAKEHPKIIKLIPADRNLGMINNFIATLQHCSGKYLAFCDGDDFWTDSLKLQKQIDFLENNPDYGMVHTDINIVNSDNVVIGASNFRGGSGDGFYELLSKSAFIATCSVCLNNTLVKEILNYGVKNNLKCIFDYWLWLHVAIRSRIHYDPHITSAYRSHNNGISLSNNKFFHIAIPLAVLDVISYKFEHYHERRFKYRWVMYIMFCRAFLARNISLKSRKKYLWFLIFHPISLIALILAVLKKIGNTFLSLK